MSAPECLRSADAAEPLSSESLAVEVHGTHCGGCHLRLPPALLQQLRRNEDALGCPHCRRPLTAGAPTPQLKAAGPHCGSPIQRKRRRRSRGI